MKILSVDDSRIIRTIIGEAAAVLGYDCLEAANGEEALNLMGDHAQDVALVTLDWNMPVMDGLATLKALQEHPSYRRVPVMMITSQSERAHIVEAIQAGARNYLIKPFHQEDLITRMMECLDGPT